MITFRSGNSTDTGLVYLNKSTNVQILTIIGCENITDSGVAELQKALRTCKNRR